MDYLYAAIFTELLLLFSAEKVLQETDQYQTHATDQYQTHATINSNYHKNIENWDFLNIALVGLLNFSQFMKEMKIWDFQILVEVVLQISSNLPKSWKTGIYQFPFHIFVDCEDSLSGMVCL